ncbi:MAG: hypothetical protein SNG38_09150 [Rikenellaceae bacterium]
MSVDSSTDYYFLLWADNGESYDIGTLANISLVDGQDVTDAWQGTLAINGGEATTYTAPLKRAVAKVNFVEIEGYNASTLSVSYDAYTSFNVAEGATSGDKSAFDIVYTYNGSVVGVLNEEPLYTLASVASADVLEFTFDDTNEVFTLTNIPVQANYTTNIKGHYSALILSALSVEVDEDWSIDPNAPEVIQFNDPIFEEAVLSALGKISGEVVTYEDALTLTTLTITSLGISDVSELQYFTNLTKLYSAYNSFDTLDLSKLSQLSIIICNNNTSLVNVIFPEDKSVIQTMQIQGTSIPELDVTEMTSLSYLYAFDLPYITTLDFRNCTKLSTLNIARDYALETVYLNEGQTNSGSWVFKSITTCTFICTDANGVDTEYASGVLNGTWS